MKRDTVVLRRYHDEVKDQLLQGILPFWMDQVVDFGADGFNGLVDGQGVADAKADKGVILAARMLWTFSRAYRTLGGERNLRAAGLMYRYLRDHFVDREHGGVYWMLDHAGRPVDDTKKFYAQAFCIYAFSEYNRASGEAQALEQAMALFALVERHGRDPKLGGYIDALGRDWKPVADTRLSDKDMNSPKTMNTNLHVLEAYSDLVRQAPGGAVSEALDSLLQVFLDRIILPSGHFGLFFEMDWREVSGCTSYGHDIEGSWLLAEAAERAQRPGLRQAVEAAALRMARVTLAEGLDADGGTLNERDGQGRLHPGKEWWMVGEGMVGLLNAWQMTGEQAFLDASLAAWGCVKRGFVRQDGEWWAHVRADGTPDLERPLAGPWKCPYHTSRTCFEIMHRTEGA